ncbi:MAG: DUF349 domain-containing protein [Paludibacteraceae bacterium]|nr:DUF349 domain-containing protein [Paludibacteraceae bacterium]
MASTRQELIDELKALMEQDVMVIKDQVEHIKTQFYKEESDELEEEFKAVLAEYKSKRAEAVAVAAKEQEANLKRKQAILDTMKTLAEGETDAVMSALPRMRELQAEWKTIGAVAADKVQELRKAYQKYQEQFYDMVKINIELRDLDFKKNLEMKTLLCEAAERLQNNDNIVEASRALQQLHDEWAEIGPVARELREDLWERFKAASTIINKKHQAFFDELHAKEQENLNAKRAIIEQLQALITEMTAEDAKKDAKAWEEATEQVQKMQEAWRKIGFAPKKYNQSIYDEYRAECDKFFQAKKAFFLTLRERRKEREQRHKEYLERVKAREERQREREEKMQKMVAKGGESLRRMRDKLQQEIKTAENNILFFTAKSKTANKLVDDMQKKIDVLKKQLEDIKTQIDKAEEE